VFTGALKSMTVREAADVAGRAGSQVVSAVSRRTSLLVVGLRGWPLLPDGTVSRKLRRAEELNARGAGIQIVSEDVFLEMAGLAPPRAAPPKQHDRSQVCQLLRISPETLGRWEALGLIRSAGGQFDFQDLVSLQTIAQLVHRGVALRTIAASIRGLSSVLPDVERPLAQLKIVEASGALLAELGDSLVAPDGQLMLNFQTPEAGGIVRDEAGGSSLSWEGEAPPVGSPTAWLQAGLALEEQERFAEAVEAYRRALAAEPRLPEAHFNLANALRALDRLEVAREHLLLALDQDPDLAAAWYNLADVQEELGEIEPAIDSLRQALRIDPLYADARYNLALFCEEAGRADEARGHWRAYLKLDPDSTWSETARRHLQTRPD
jgi:tetratricopeptide (TPR) repeat protein